MIVIQRADSGRAVRKSLLIHVSVAVGKCSAERCDVPVVMKPHVVPELMRKYAGIALISTAVSESGHDVR